MASSSNNSAETYYIHKGRPLAHLNDLDVPAEVEECIEALVDICDALEIDDLSHSTYASAIDKLDTEELSIARSLLHAQHAEDQLTHHLMSALHEEQLIDKWTQDLRSTKDENETIPALERKKAALTAKAKEYKKELDELTSNMPEAPPLSITELAAFRKKLKQQEQVLKEKRARVETFQGLPPNIHLARHALQEARDKQMELIQLRERLLGKMVDSVN